MTKYIPRKSTLLSLIGAAFYVLCFPKWSSFYLSPLVGFFYCWSLEKTKSQRELFQNALFANFLIGLGGFYWIAGVIAHFGNLPFAVGVLVLIAFCFIACPQLYLFFAVSHFCGKTYRPLLLPIFYAASEYVLHFCKTLPEHLGNTLIHWLPIAQNAQWGGTAILSFLPISIGVAGFTLFRERKVLPLISSCLLLIAMYWYGNQALNRIDQAPKTEKTFALIQANIGDNLKVASERGSLGTIRYIVGKYLELSQKVPQADLIVWPETAYPTGFPTSAESHIDFTNLQYSERVQQFVREKKVPLLTGAYENTEENQYNSALLLRADLPIQSYRKKHLLILGEYMPLGSIFPFLKKLNPELGDFTPGKGAIPLAWTDKLKLGVNICYEEIIPDYIRQFRLAGAQILLNITNDSWYGDTFEPYQHLELAALRTIENQVPMLRVTNTGISGFINPKGVLEQSSHLFQEEVLVLKGQIPDLPLSIYTRYGDWLAQIFSLIMGIFLLRAYFTKKRMLN